MSSWSWPWAPLPIRTGRDPRHPSRCGTLELLHPRTAADPVHELERAGAVRVGVPPAVAEPVHEPHRLAGEPDPEQGVQGERSVADPGEPVVPVPDSADPLREAGRRGRD